MCARNKNRILVFCLCFMISAITILQLGCGIAIAQGIEIPKVHSNVYVYDEEDILTDQQEHEINLMLKYLDEKTTVEFAVVTTDSFNGYSIEDYAHDLFNNLGIGKKGKDNGILLLVSATERHGRLEIGYGIEDILTDSKCGAILDKCYVVHRDKEEHSDSICETVKGVLSVLGKHYGIELVENQDEIIKDIEKADSMKEIKLLIFAMIFVLIMAAFIAVIDDGSIGGGHYGGGFHSSGGGGHFGGGFSGGGGASR